MKKKSCKRCLKEKPIFARGLCKSCDIVENPQKYLISKKSTKVTKTTKKKESVTILKKKLDTYFSLYIRLRDADENLMVTCFTSGKVMKYTEAHAGHYVSRKHLSTRWNETNVQVQSVAENMFNQGNAPMFAIKLDDKFGQGTARNMVELSLIPFKQGIDWYREQVAYYKEQTEILKVKLNIT
jgi:hypothetical protein